MQIAIFAYDHMTALDAVGPYEILSRLPGAETIVVGEHRGPVRCDTQSLALVADATIDEVNDTRRPRRPRLVRLQRRRTFCAPGRSRTGCGPIDRHTTWTTSIGTGAIVLAAAGLLTGRRATTHWLAVDWLAELGAVPAARAGRARRQVRHRRRRVGRHRHEPHARRRRSPTTGPPRRSSSFWSTTRSHRSTAARWTRRRPTMVTSMRALRGFIVNGAPEA